MLSFESVIPAGFRLESGTKRADEHVHSRQVFRQDAFWASETLPIQDLFWDI
jgi:hypothetical protein